MIRQLKIRNSIGYEYNLNDTNLFGYDPSGLGISFSNGYIATGTSFIPTVQTLNQGQFSLNLLFGAIQENAYVTFFDFVNFLNYQPYVLIYQTDAGEYQRVCQLSTITKTEIKIGKALDENMVLDFITPWYTYREGSTDIDSSVVYDQAGDGKIYEYNVNIIRDTVDIIGDPNFTSLFSSSTGYWNMMNKNDRDFLYKLSQVVQQGYQTIRYDRITQWIGNIYHYYANTELYMYYNANMSALPSNYGTLTFQLSVKMTAYSASNRIWISPVNSNDYFVPCVVSDKTGKIINSSYYGKEVFYEFDRSMSWFTIKLTFLKNSTTPTLDRIYIETDSPTMTIDMVAPKLIAEVEETPPPPDPPPPPPVEPEDPPPPAYIPGQSYSSPRPFRVYEYIYEEENPIPIGNQFTIINNSKLFNEKVKSPILITVNAQNGAIENPSWEVWSNGELVSSDGYNLTIPAGGRLIVSSFPDNQFAVMIDDEYNQTNVYQYQDMTKTGFVTLAQGENDINFNVGNGIVTYQMREEHLIV